MTNIESTTASLDDVTFPTMHICNINQLRQSFLNQYEIEENSKEFELLMKEYFEGRNKSLTRKEEQSLKTLDEKLVKINHSFALEFGHQCSDMMVFSEWKSLKKTQRNLHDFSAAINDYGKCCYIIPQIHFEDDYSQIVNKPNSPLTPEHWSNIPTGRDFSFFFNLIVYILSWTDMDEFQDWFF